MKLIQSCDHVDPEDLKRWANAKDDGKFTIITELCGPCFLKALPSLKPEEVRSMPAYFVPTGEDTTLGDLMDRL